MDIENLIFSIFDFTFSILIVLGEIFIFAIILLIYGVIIYKKFHKKQNYNAPYNQNHLNQYSYSK